MSGSMTSSRSYTFYVVEILADLIASAVKALHPELNCSKTAPGFFTPIGDKAPPAARYSSEVARALDGRCYSHTGNGELSWCLSSSLPLSVGFSIQDGAINIVRSSPQGGHYCGDAILEGIYEGTNERMVLLARSKPTRFPVCMC